MADKHVLDKINEFKENIEPHKDQWRSIDIRVIAVTSFAIRNLATKIRPLPDPPDKVKRETNLPNIGSLKAIQDVWEINKLDELLKSLADGELNLKETKIHYDQSNDSPGFLPSFSRNQRGAEYTSSSMGWTYYSLTSEGARRNIDINDLNKKLQMLDAPYHSLQELLSIFTFPRVYVNNYYTSWIEIDAIFGVRILGFKWDESKTLKIQLEVMPFCDPKELDLGLIYKLKSGGSERTSEKIDNLSLEHSHIAEIKLLPPDNCYQAIILLRRKKIAIDEITISYPPLNPMLNIYEKKFDKNLDTLKSDLSPIGKNSDDFEKAIKNLLFFCGLFPAPFIDRKDNGRVDIRGSDALVFDPIDKNLLIVECTTSSFSSDKLEKLRYRTQSLNDIGYQALPVIFTTIAKKDLAKDIKEKAQNDKISIITKEDIEKLLSLAKSNVGPNEVSKFIYQCIPSIPKSDKQGFDIVKDLFFL